MSGEDDVLGEWDTTPSPADSPSPSAAKGPSTSAWCTQ